jgi:hypothetical protein
VPEGTEKHFPSFMPDSTFYSVLRERVHEYLKQNGGSGPTTECLVLWHSLCVSFIVFLSLICFTGSSWFAVPWGLVSGLMATYGHNWIHQPKYRLYATIGLDCTGLSSENWLREHTLQHHMYTNTP